MPINCGSAKAEVIESARRGGICTAALRRHLDGCSACSERWSAQMDLSAGLSEMRAAANHRQSPAATRASLLAAFDGNISVTGPRRPVAPGWFWTLATAAVFLLAAVLVRDVALHTAGGAARNGRPGSSTALSDVSSGSDLQGIDSQNTDSQAEAGDFQASEAQQEGFIEVPYALPLAEGELVRVVHTELQPAALASMGVNVDPSWVAELPADLLLGEDGFPRAVRVSNDDSSAIEF